MDAGALVQRLLGDGFMLRLSDDGERIIVNTSLASLTDAQKAEIREHKAEIIAYLKAKIYDPKVAKGAIHYTLNRAQRQMEKKQLTPEQRASLIVTVAPKLTLCWHALEKHDIIHLKSNLRHFYRAVCQTARDAASGE